LQANQSDSGRLQLAQWLTDPKNPLTARVMVNRIWQHHFGKGIVPTPNDFGKQGQAPTHPELLDHLASHFIASRWSIKAMHKLGRRGNDHAEIQGVALELGLDGEGFDLLGRIPGDEHLLGRLQNIRVLGAEITARRRGRGRTGQGGAEGRQA
jgi:hypothetical protein